MTFQKMMWGVAAFAVVGAGIAGCSGGAGEKTAEATAGTTGTTAGTPDAGPKKDFKIVMIAKSSNNAVFAASKVGAEDAAKELSAKNNANITIDWQTPNEEDAEEQSRRITAAVNNGANAILVSCSAAAKVTKAIDDAVDGGVPVMTFDSDAPDSKRFAFYGADDEAAGAQVMSELNGVMSGKGNFAILAGSQNAPNLQKRVKGVLDEAKKYPGFKFVGTFYHKEDSQSAAAEVTRAMNANPQIDCWAMVGGWPLFNTSLLNSLDPAKVKIVAVDALPEQLAYVQKGLAPILLAQPVYDWGYKSVGIIVDKVLLKKDVPAINKMDLVKVDKASLATWAKQLQDWKFKVDPEFLK